MADNSEILEGEAWNARRTDGRERPAQLFSIDETRDRENNTVWEACLITADGIVQTEQFYDREKAHQYVETHWPSAIEA